MKDGKSLKNSYSFSLLKRTIWQNWYYMLCIMLLSAVASLLSAVSPLIYQKIIDDAIPDKDFQTLIFYIVIMTALPIINVILSNVRNKVGFKFSDKCSKVMRRACFEKILSMKYPAFEKLGATKLMSTVTRGVGKVTELYINSDVVHFVDHTVQLVVIFIILSHYNIYMALISFLVIPILSISIKLFSKKVSEIYHERLNHLNAGEKFLLQCFYGMKTIRSYNGQNREISNFDEWLEKNTYLGWKEQRINRLIRVLIPTSISQIVLGGLFVGCALLVMRDTMTMGTLVAIIAYVPSLINAVNGLLGINVGKASISRIMDDLDSIFLEEKENNEDSIKSLTIKEGSALSFDNVQFSYGRGEFFLQIEDLFVSAGDFLVIVGESGGGKTSLLDILNKFYPITEGKISFFGEDFFNVDSRTIRDHVSSVFQDVYIFNRDVRSNISYPNDPDDSKIKDVIRKAQLTDFIAALPDGENTVISDFGANFSGGECQRISLARALYKDADILLLDEPTAALDAITSKAVFDLLKKENLENNKTVILITHDISKAFYATKVIVMSEGKIVESGTPDNLLAKNGVFKLLYDAHRNKQE